MINERGIWLSRDETDTHEFDKKLCPAIIKLFKCYSFIIDIGCGNGAYVKEMKKAGLNCVGYDGSPLTPELTQGECRIIDFSKPVDVGKIEAVLCLEVGEHIPQAYERVFIDNVCRISGKIVVLSWAIEGQGGTGHFNCRNNDYIIGEMDKRGFRYNSEISNFLRNSSSLSWFKNTLMVFVRNN